MNTKYYIIPVFRCVEPEPLIGPFKTYEGMVKRAQKVYLNQHEGDAIFYLKLEDGKRPTVGTFSNDEIPS
jgi:hypothetical protein